MADETYELEPGNLRHPIIIQSPSRTAAGDGSTLLNWTNAATRRAAIRPLSATEVLRMQQPQGSVTHRITIRYYEGLNPTYRFQYGSRVFEIAGVMNIDERNRVMECLCKEQVSGAVV